ncbi:MAG: PilT/PilU family type 4a pilus ATPase [Kiritimatiellia bacterium]
MSLSLHDILVEAVTRGASDIHLKGGCPPVYRIHAELAVGALPTLSAEELTRLAAEHLPGHLKEEFATEREADFAILDPVAGRFRVSLFVTQGAPAMVLRHVKAKVPTLEQLSLPPVLAKLVEIPQGIVVLTGATGSGKSTTLAALIQILNDTQRLRIVTIEDPIEYQFSDNECLITQREVGPDTLSFHAALKRVLRQDPDVIVVGEMRDETTFETALGAAETGHLVFTTLHASSAPHAVTRILNMFPESEREQIRLNLAGNLKAILCQQLIPGIPSGVKPAVEILINTPTVRKLIEKNRLEVLAAAIETGSGDGMQSFNQSLYQLIRNGQISEREGMLHSFNPEQLGMNLKGIFLDEGKRILPT